ncbi:ABC transporter permease [Conexibacter woesei]|uniref:Binding-protein-dependent transport systems inner membrane component n=1 Tax=Conexibacter woesei (strain DSM 14684 / CCUG 47730 / CIP 108061 / JCM 11494 / NBRC 100937 / ID131577) TaxID=469383 RepID=D3F6I2_CONWI|nr:ABC transporter permease [Conexibacter woesei]ADB50749.1 binding-protein-dependent transport systems inner membrane component [Conexibacter woesei DSM 14684]
MSAATQQLAGARRLSRLARPRPALVFVGVVVAVCLLGWLVAPHPVDLPSGRPLTGPSGAHLMGTDEGGRDIFSRVLLGARSTLLSVVAVIFGSLVIGGVVGTLAGLCGGVVDWACMRLTDLFLALPGPVLAIAIVAALGASLRNTLIAVAIVWWPLYARVVRGSVRQLVALPHVDAARMAGASGWRLAWRHVLPGVRSTLLVAASLDVGMLVLSLSLLSFLGLGSAPPAAELGAMAARGMPYLLQQWWVAVFPAAMLALMALAGNVAGDLLRDRGLER